MNTIPDILNPTLSNSVMELATTWRITRTDGTIYRFTDHDQSIKLNLPAETFVPTDGVSSSARQRNSGLQVNNAELYGVLSSSAITANDLRAGRFREALIEEMIVNWRYPWAGPLLSSRYWVQKVTWTGESWEAAISTTAAWLNRKVGNVFGRTCRHILGDSMCKANAMLPVFGGSFSLSGQTVTSVQNANNEFTASGITGQPDNQWGFGNVTWLTGDNAGLSTEVKTNDTAGAHIFLQLPTPNAIQVGDTFNIQAGCDKTVVSCVARFRDTGEPIDLGNINNFGGFPTMPGTDRILEGPPPKGEDGIVSKLGLDYFK